MGTAEDGVSRRGPERAQQDAASLASPDDQWCSLSCQFPEVSPEIIRISRTPRPSDRFSGHLHACFMADRTRAHREVMRQLADARRTLAAAQDALAEAQAAAKQAETAFDSANDRFAAAEAALDAAREERAQARTARYAARQSYEQATVTADRLARRVRELSERLDRMPQLPGRAMAQWPDGREVRR